MNKAGAIIVGSRRGSGKVVWDAAESLDFGYVKRFDARQMPSRETCECPLCFFLFPEVANLEEHAPAVAAIRHSDERCLAFAPLIYFAEDPPREVVNACVALGFDDIVAMPFTPDRMRLSLMRQIGMPHIYYQTETYFGPDRRRNAPPRLADAYLRGAERGWTARRFEIRRSLSSGVTVTHEEVLSGPGHRGAA